MDLQDIRIQIDTVDEQLVDLFCRRMALSSEVAAYKKKNNLPIAHPEREREVQNKAVQQAGAYGTYVHNLYANLFEMSRSLQRTELYEPDALSGEIQAAVANSPTELPATSLIACQGVEGAYSAAATEKLFPSGNIMFFDTFAGVFDAVENNLCQYGMLPIENSIYGTVNEVYDLMRTHKFHIARSVRLKINHVLLGKHGADMNEIKKIYSHPQAIGQCRAYLKTLKGVEFIPCANTAIAAKMVAENNDNSIAAICSRNCASLYDLSVLAEDVQDNAINETRFICISKNLQILPGASRISIMLSVAHKPGSLYMLLAKFAALGINLTKIESRPIPGGDFNVIFYLDFEASVQNENVIPLLSEAKNSSETFAFLGNYSEV